MNQTATIVSVVSILACLLLALRGLNGRAVDFSQSVKLAFLWLAIIAGVTALVAWSGLRLGP